MQYQEKVVASYVNNNKNMFRELKCSFSSQLVVHLSYLLNIFIRAKIRNKKVN